MQLSSCTHPSAHLLRMRTISLGPAGKQHQTPTLSHFKLLQHRYCCWLQLLQWQGQQENTECVSIVQFHLASYTSMLSFPKPGHLTQHRHFVQCWQEISVFNRCYWASVLIQLIAEEFGDRRGWSCINKGFQYIFDY